MESHAFTSSFLICQLAVERRNGCCVLDAGFPTPVTVCSMTAVYMYARCFAAVDLAIGRAYGL